MSEYFRTRRFPRLRLSGRTVPTVKRLFRTTLPLSRVHLKVRDQLSKICQINLKAALAEKCWLAVSTVTCKRDQAAMGFFQLHVDSFIQVCGDGTHISGSSSRHLNFLAPALTSRSFGSGSKTIWSFEN